MRRPFALYFFVCLALFNPGALPASADEAEIRLNETSQQAERGDPAAQFALATMYAQGDGVDQDIRGLWRGRRHRRGQADQRGEKAS